MMRKLLLLCLIAWLAPPLQAQTCMSTIEADAPDERYTDNQNGGVTDIRTGLIWKRCSEGQSWDSIQQSCTGSAATYTWQAALARAVDHNLAGGYAGHSDWRLPNRNELTSLVERKCYSPTINLAWFPNTPGSHYWSASPDAYDSDHAWRVHFYGGYVNGYGKDGTFHVRLVRGGQ